MAFTFETVGTTAIGTTTDTPIANQLARTFADMVRAAPDWSNDPLMGVFPPEYITGDRKTSYVGEGRLPVADRFTRVDAEHPVQPNRVPEVPVVGLATKWSQSIKLSRSVDLVSSYNTLEGQLMALFAACRRQRMSKLLRVLEAIPSGDATKKNAVQILVDVDGTWGYNNDTLVEMKQGSVQSLNFTKLHRGYSGLMAGGCIQDDEMVFPLTSYGQWQQLRNDPRANHADRNSGNMNYTSSHGNLEQFKPLVDLGDSILYRNMATGEGPTVTSGNQYDWLIGNKSLSCIIPEKVPYMNSYSKGSVENMPGTVLEIFELPEKDVLIAAVHDYSGFYSPYPNGLARIQNKQAA